MLKFSNYEDAVHNVSLTGNRLSGLQPWEARWLINKIGKYPGDVVEIGTFLGATAREIAAAYPKKQVYCVDIHDPAYGLKLEEVGSQAKEYPNVKLFIQDSKSFKIPEGVSVIFIDGDHTWNGVKLDTEKAVAYMRGKSPACIIWHDYCQVFEVMPYLDWAVEHGISEILHVNCTNLAFRDF